MAFGDRKKVAPRDWASLLPEMIGLIGTKIKVPADYVRFRAVCTPWRSSSPAIPTHIPCQLPWQLLPPPPPGGDDGDNRRSIIEVATNKHLRLRLPETVLPRQRHRVFRGSSHGWIAMLEDSPSLTLLNPLTGAEISLPPLSKLPLVVHFDASNVGREYTLREYSLPEYNFGSTPSPSPIFGYCSHDLMQDMFVRRVVLSDSPRRRPEDFVAVAVSHGIELAFCKSGEDFWTPVPGITSDVDHAVVFQGKVYTADILGLVSVCDVSGASPRVVTSGVHMEEKTGDAVDVSLVSSGDQLFYVTRHLIDEFDEESETRELRVYRLSLCGKRWERVRDLGGLALFLGRDHCSTASMASDFPGCKSNAVYFVEFNGELSVFSLEDGSIQRNVGVFLPRFVDSIWFTPNPF